MKLITFLPFVALSSTLAAASDNAKPTSHDISASIANFRAALDPEHSETPWKYNRHLSKLYSRKCKDLEGWKYCVSTCLELCDMICDCGSCPSNCVNECAKKEQFKGCNGKA
uniref:WGS project CBMI000000000 data, contig CS3069_c002657 n=1 Tax=Fusarium clavum TaxID=2594811 RepID=A0A090MH63_9HYPO|nr:unnamed protein product [Fusarium clavum]